jgi:cyclopropane-fatty-acyl-phospholipid synthase
MTSHAETIALPKDTLPKDRRFRLALRLARMTTRGHLTVVLPDGSVHRIDNALPGPTAEVRLRDPRLPGKFLAGGSLAWAEAYVDGWWDSPDIRAVMAFAAANEAEWETLLNGRPFVRALSWLFHRLKPNTRRGSRRNISAHYDLGNSFYAQWLDPTMTYSSAIFADAAEPMEVAQARKVEALCQSLALAPGRHVLEIGCGWGFLAQTAAQKFGARVTAITISREQHDLAARRIAEAGLSDRVEIRLQDWRDVQGQYDAIASVEMIEAVGEKNWPAYFQALHDRLLPGGAAGIQAITIEDRLYPLYRRSADFIQRHVFPGGMLPSPTILRTRAAEAGLRWEQERWFGQDYAETLARWAHNFHAAWPRISALPPGPTGARFDTRFHRLWDYYLAYCETGFRAGWTDVGQVVLRRTA